MKKALATILAFVYLSTSMGATIHLHYCMGKLISWDLIDHASKNCSQCGMVKKTSASPSYMADKMDCCRDEHKQIKTDKDQKLFPAEFLKYNNLAQAITLHELITPGKKAFSAAIAYPNTDAPPLLGNLPLFIIYCNFRL